MFKWNYEQHLYTHTLIPIINRFASTNEPLNYVTLSDQDVLSKFYSLASLSLFKEHRTETAFILNCRCKYVVLNHMRY